MDLDWLRDFIALAEHGNFSRAADARHVTQPAFSRRVRALEDWIGTPLFVRSAQGAVLSAAGQAFQPLAADLVARLERARRETLAAGEQQTSSLSIAATHALSFTFFPRWINQQVDLPTLGTLNLVSDTMEACEQAMLSGEVHFLLCHWHDGMRLNLDPDRYCSIRVGQDALTAVSAPDEQGRPIWRIPGTKETPTRLLGYSPASGLGRILASRPSHASHADGIEAVFTSHLAATLLVMARDRRGAAWLPLTMVKDDLEARRLVKAADDTLHLAIDIRLFRSPDCRNRASDELWELLSRRGSAG
jgi:LysR family transcriptional regulator, hypochlorite-specific transcription factor HypT